MSQSELVLKQLITLISAPLLLSNQTLTVLLPPSNSSCANYGAPHPLQFYPLNHHGAFWIHFSSCGSSISSFLSQLLWFVDSGVLFVYSIAAWNFHTMHAQHIARQSFWDFFLSCICFTHSCFLARNFSFFNGNLLKTSSKPPCPLIFAKQIFLYRFQEPYPFDFCHFILSHLLSLASDDCTIISSYQPNLSLKTYAVPWLVVVQRPSKSYRWSISL